MTTAIVVAVRGYLFGPRHMHFKADTLISFYGGLVPVKMFIYRTYIVHF